MREALWRAELHYREVKIPKKPHKIQKRRLMNLHQSQLSDLADQRSRSHRHIAIRGMAMEAERLLEEEVEAFEVWWRSLETVSTISCLRDKVEAIREQELEKALSRLGSEFAERHQEVIEALTRGIVNKILHDPMVQLRSQQDIEARRRAMQTLQTLFNLDVGEQFS